MLRFEFEPPSTSGRCEHCGAQTTSLTRFIYDDEGVAGVYYARFSDNHPDRIVSALVSLGDWAEGSTPVDRTAFALELRSMDDHYSVMVVDSEQSPWREASIVGRLLDREEALQHDWIKEVFHVTDHMVVEDAPLKAYLDGGAA